MSSSEWITLSESLRRLEQEDPEVGEAARRLDEVIASINFRYASGIRKTRFHKSTPDTPCEPY